MNFFLTQLWMRNIYCFTIFFTLINVINFYTFLSVNKVIKFYTLLKSVKIKVLGINYFFVVCILFVIEKSNMWLILKQLTTIVRGSLVEGRRIQGIHSFLKFIVWYANINLKLEMNAKNWYHIGRVGVVNSFHWHGPIY